MGNLFAWASIGENGKAVGGKAGDQTGREVRVGNYYYFGQNEVLRFKSAVYGRIAGKIAKELANNAAIGYNQAQRNTLYDVAKACGWNKNRLNKALKDVKVNCDCSSFCSTVINLAIGKQVVGCDTTRTIAEDALGSGYFKLLPLSDASAKWHKGDMPLKAGKHIIINV